MTEFDTKLESQENSDKEAASSALIQQALTLYQCPQGFLVRDPKDCRSSNISRNGSDSNAANKLALK
jgi:hypothetical protein